MDKLLYLTLLYDFYGELLTTKQQNFFEMYYHENLSLSEIAGHYNITPQGVSDHLKRTEKLLNNYEDKLMLLNRHKNRKKISDALQKIIDNTEVDSETKSNLKQQILNMIE